MLVNRKPGQPGGHDLSAGESARGSSRPASHSENETSEGNPLTRQNRRSKAYTLLICFVEQYQDASSPFRKYGLFLAANGAYLIGLLTKESIIVLPVLLFGLDWFRVERVAEWRQFGARFFKMAVPYLGFVGGLAI